MYTTLAEIKRTCRVIASTAKNPKEYKTLKAEASSHGAILHVIEWDNITIYSNQLYYIVVYQEGNILELYKLIS